MLSQVAFSFYVCFNFTKPFKTINSKFLWRTCDDHKD